MALIFVILPNSAAYGAHGVKGVEDVVVEKFTCEFLVFILNAGLHDLFRNVCLGLWAENVLGVRFRICFDLYLRHKRKWPLWNRLTVAIVMTIIIDEESFASV